MNAVVESSPVGARPDWRALGAPDLAANIDPAAVATATFDLTGHVLQADPSWARMHCRSPDSIVGKHLGLFHTAEQLRYGGEVDLRELEAGNPVTAAVGHVRRDGSTFCTAMTTSPIRDAQQQLAGFVRSARDVGAGPGKPPAMNVPDNPFGAGELLAQLACVG